MVRPVVFPGPRRRPVTESGRQREPGRRHDAGSAGRSVVRLDDHRAGRLDDQRAQAAHRGGPEDHQSPGGDPGHGDRSAAGQRHAPSPTTGADPGSATASERMAAFATSGVPGEPGPTTSHDEDGLGRPPRHPGLGCGGLRRRGHGCGRPRSARSADTVIEYGDPERPAGHRGHGQGGHRVGRDVEHPRASPWRRTAPRVTSAATGDAPGLPTTSVTFPPWTAVVWANRQVVADEGVPATSASPASVRRRDPVELGGHHRARRRLDQRGHVRLVLDVGAEGGDDQLAGTDGDALVGLGLEHGTRRWSGSWRRPRPGAAVGLYRERSSDPSLVDPPAKSHWGDTAEAARGGAPTGRSADDHRPRHPAAGEGERRPPWRRPAARSPGSTSTGPERRDGHVALDRGRAAGGDGRSSHRGPPTGRRVGQHHDARGAGAGVRSRAARAEERGQAGRPPGATCTPSPAGDRRGGGRGRGDE